MSARLDALLVLALVGGGTLVAYRLGGGAEPSVAPPKPEARAPAPQRGLTSDRTSGCVRLLFVGGGGKRRVTGRIAAPTSGAAPRIELIGIPATEVHRDGAAFDLSFDTMPTRAVGLVVRVTPPEAALSWNLSIDGEPLPGDRVFGGPYGVVSPFLRGGLVSAADWRRALAPAVPEIDPRREVGLFVAAGCDLESPTGDAAARLE